MDDAHVLHSEVTVQPVRDVVRVGGDPLHLPECPFVTIADVSGESAKGGALPRRRALEVPVLQVVGEAGRGVAVVDVVPTGPVHHPHRRVHAAEQHAFEIREQGAASLEGAQRREGLQRRMRHAPPQHVHALPGHGRVLEGVRLRRPGHEAPRRMAFQHVQGQLLRAPGNKHEVVNERRGRLVAPLVWLAGHRTGCPAPVRRSMAP